MEFSIWAITKETGISAQWTIIALREYTEHMELLASGVHPIKIILSTNGGEEQKQSFQEIKFTTY